MIRTRVLKHFPGARKSERGESKGDVVRGATARQAMEKSRYARVIERKVVRRGDSIDTSSLRGSEIIFKSQKK